MNSKPKSLVLFSVVLILNLACALVAGAPTPTSIPPTNTVSPTATPVPTITPSPTERIIYTTEPDCSDPAIFCVGLVTDVGIVFDGSFNQSSWEGIQQSQEDGTADWIDYIETKNADDYSNNIETFAEKHYDVIVTVGFALAEASEQAAKNNPNIKFIGVDQFPFWQYDNTSSNDVTNLASLNFPEDQGGFLMGALAAMVSGSHKIGAVCGTDLVPPVWRYGEGYAAGAAYADSKYGTETEVIVVYHNDVGFDKTFLDPQWGEEKANSMIADGVDVVFGCGGITGNGAILAAAQANVLVLGVDVDQYLTLPEVRSQILSSGIKLISPGVTNLIKMAREGDFPAGFYVGSAGYAPFHELEDKIPPEIKSRMDEIQTLLTNGTIKTNVPAAKP